MLKLLIEWCCRVVLHRLVKSLKEVCLCTNEIYPFQRQFLYSWGVALPVILLSSFTCYHHSWISFCMSLKSSYCTLQVLRQCRMPATGCNFLCICKKVSSPQPGWKFTTKKLQRWDNLLDHSARDAWSHDEVFFLVSRNNKPLLLTIMKSVLLNVLLVEKKRKSKIESF